VYELIKSNRGNRRSNRTAAYISRSNPYLKVTQRTDLCKDPDLQILEISTDLIPSFFLINIYNEHDATSNLYTVPRSLAHLSLPRRCIITGDLNAHNALWNCQVHTPRRAQELAALIEEQNWRLVNVPDTPTYYYRNGKGSSILDLTLATPHMAEEITNWAIDDEQATGSDHEVIRFQVVSMHPNVEVTPHEPRLNWRKTDWDKFTTIIKNSSAATRTQWERYRSNPSPTNLDTWAILLRDIIKRAAELSTPYLDTTPRSKRWWTEDISTARTNMNHARRRWKRTHNDTHHQEFRQLRNTYYRTIPHAKDSMWKEYLSQAEGPDVWTALRFTNPRKAQMTPELHTVHNGTESICTDFETKVRAFQILFPEPPPAPPTTHTRDRPEIPWQTFSQAEVERAIFTSSPKKAPGPDAITFACIRAAYKAIPLHFDHLYKKNTPHGNGDPPPAFATTSTETIDFSIGFGFAALIYVPL
jgi:hypothetical protein